MLPPSESASMNPGTAIVVGPGPRTMSAEEKALGTDPAAAQEPGIILVDETVRNEESGSTEILRHVRAKILGDEARSLAEVEIPYPRGSGVLKRWWGFTILPDGKVLEVEQGDLTKREIQGASRSRFTRLGTTLAGAVPGCVIDYGFHFEAPGIHSWPRVDLQIKYPVRQLRYRWVPYPSDVAAFRLFHSEGLSIQVLKDMHSVLVTGSRLPPAQEEPSMPPEREARASVLFYYRENAARPEKYWDHEADRLLRRAKDFAPKKAIQGIIASMDLPPDASLQARLKAAYEHAGASYRNTTLRASEEAEPLQSDVGRSSRSVLDLLERKEATAWELDLLYLGIARGLGADAGLVLATDRTDHYFDPQLLTMRQFSSSLVAVKGPGEPDDRFVFVDLGSGLPFGQIPWWLSGGSAFMAADSGRTVMIPPSEAAQNLLQTSARITFDEGSVRMSWSSDGAGQEGLWERLKLRTMSPEERRKTLAEMCGASEDFEVSRKVAPSLQDLSEAFHLECEGRRSRPSLNADTTRYEFRLRGPYLREAPRFSAEARSLPVVFPYRRIESLSLEVRSPEGFVPAGATPPEPFESPFGRYALFVRTTPEGYHVERVYALTGLQVPPEEYGRMKTFFDRVAAGDDILLPFERVSLP